MFQLQATPFSNIGRKIGTSKQKPYVTYPGANVLRACAGCSIYMCTVDSSPKQQLLLGWSRPRSSRLLIATADRRHPGISGPCGSPSRVIELQVIDGASGEEMRGAVVLRGVGQSCDTPFDT